VRLRERVFTTPVRASTDKLPAGEVYGYTEAGNGELGFSRAMAAAHRIAYAFDRRCFFTTAGVELMIRNQLLSDVVPCFGSINMVGGECDH
jgi:NADH-quinone oxidoreductase subunit D